MTINVFMAPDLTTEMQPLLDAMTKALEGKIQTTGRATQTALTSVKAEVNGVAADVAEVQTDVNDLTTVNGKISTDVQAINQHTDSALGALAVSPIKNIYRGVYHNSSANEATISIPAVNMDKTVVNMLSSVAATSAATYEGRKKFGRASYIYAYLSSPKTLAMRNKVEVLKPDDYGNLYSESWYVPIHWEVIEYA